MTEQEIRTLDFIRERVAATQTPPTLEEISEHMGWSAKSSAHRVVTSLVWQGFLVRKSGSTRGIALADVPKLALVSTDELRAELARRGAI